MTASDADRGVRIRAWMRDQVVAAIPERQSEIISQLRRLEGEDRISGFSVRVWGKQIEADGADLDGATNDVRERIAEFEAWADHNGHSLEPAFSRRTKSVPLTDEQREVIVPPVICLAVYEDDELVGVFPCSNGDGTNTVDDCLNGLGNGESGDGSPMDP